MMNRATMLPEMLHCTDMNLTVLERQRARLKLWQHDHFLHQEDVSNNYFGELGSVFQQQQSFEGDLGEVVIRSVKPDPSLLENGCWSGRNNDDLVSFGTYNHSNNNGSGNFDMNFAISRATSCPQTMAAAAADATATDNSAVLTKARESLVSEKLSSVVNRESFKKRKADNKLQNNSKIVAEDENCRNKRIKICAEEGDSKITEKNNSNKSSSSNSKNNNKENSGDNSKVTDVQKPDYIHVRARRGQATDSHSLAERVRREKISERMKYLQDLVPGCNKITGKAGMLDEIINYVQSLQRQVEFLSMKLAAVNPRLDCNIDNLFAKEQPFPPCPTNFPAIGMSTDMTNAALFQLNQLQQQQQQLVNCCGLDLGINPADLGLRRTISSPVSVPDQSFIDSSCFNQIPPSTTWDADLQNLYNVAFDQGRSSTSFPTEPFTGTNEASNLKMEM